MRVLTINEDSQKEIWEANYAQYDDNIFETEDLLKKRHGLYISNDEEMFYIEDVSEARCEQILEELLVKGYADLSSLGVCKELSAEDIGNGLSNSNNHEDDTQYLSNYEKPEKNIGHVFSFLKK